MNLTTTYLGKKLRSPLVVSANPLSDNIDNIKRMEDAGAGAVVLTSLFEEQLRHEQHALYHYLTFGTESNPEGLTHFPEPEMFHNASDAYLEHIRQAKEAVDIPIIASLNGSTPGGWTKFAKKIEQAGADALELNLYAIPTDPNQAAANVEWEYRNTALSVKEAVTIPVAVKLSPYFTNMANIAKQFESVKVDALVLFNRFYQPDIDLETREVVPNVLLSTPQDLRLPLRWIAILYRRVNVDFAATSGIHSGTDAIKAIMVGANVTMLASALLARGIDHLSVVEREMREWMLDHEYESIHEMCGSVSQFHCEHPSEFERAQYMKALKTFVVR